MKILIDNGHGRETAGKRSPDGRLLEWSYNREIACLVVATLQSEHFYASLLVPEDEDIPLAERCKRVNRVCSELGRRNVCLISIHVNAAGRGNKWYTIPAEIVAKSLRPSVHSDFTRFLATIFDPIILEGLVDEYRLGVTRDRAVIFYQIDIQDRVRTGKVMKYDPETGHRIKDENTKGRITWVHSLLKYSGQLPQEWTLTQCLFGEHLLPLFPEKPVALVESEKTAIICAGLIPKFIWLATGGKSQLNARLNVLKGRSITAFPDIDGYETWCQKAAEFPELGIKVADLLQKHGTDQDRADHIDIADWLIRWHRTPNPRADATFAAVAQYFSPEVHEEIRALIHDLDLEFVGVEKIEPTEE